MAWETGMNDDLSNIKLLKSQWVSNSLYILGWMQHCNQFYSKISNPKPILKTIQMVFNTDAVESYKGNDII